MKPSLYPHTEITVANHAVDFVLIAYRGQSGRRLTGRTLILTSDSLPCPPPFVDVYEVPDDPHASFTCVYALTT